MMRITKDHLIITALICLTIPSVHEHDRQIKEAMQVCLQKQRQSSCNLIVYAR